MNNLIKKYVDSLEKDQIYEFGLKNDIVLDNNELDLIYNVVKNEYLELLNNSEFIFIKYQSYLSNDNYYKIKKLFYEYKKRYQNYL